MLALSLGCLFGWLIGLLTARLRRRNLMTVLLSLILLAAYFYGYFRINALLQTILLSGAVLAGTESACRAAAAAFVDGLRYAIEHPLEV